MGVCVCVSVGSCFLLHVYCTPCHSGNVHVAVFVCLSVSKNCSVGWWKWMGPLTRVTEVELYSHWSMRWLEVGGKCMLL